MADETQPTQHPTRVGFTRQLVMGSLLAVIGVLAAAVGLAPFGLSLVAAGMFLVGFGSWGRSAGRATLFVNQSAAAIGLRRYAEAEAALAEAEAASRSRLVRRCVAEHRGVIAMRRGDIPGALRHLDAVIALPIGLFWGRTNERQVRAIGRGIRAFLRASSGDLEGARADREAVARDPVAPADALSYAALAEAVWLEKSGDRGALRSHLEKHGTLLFDATAPRERAIVRAFQRMLKSRAKSVYREAEGSPRGEEGDEPALREWVAKLVPGAAPFLPQRPSRGADERTAAPVESSAQRADVRAPARPLAPSAGPGRRKVVALWTVLFATLAALWQLSPDGAGDQPGVTLHENPRVNLLNVVFPLAIAASIALFVVRMRRVEGDARELARIDAMKAEGELVAASAALRRLAKSPRPMTAANAELVLAQIAEGRCLLDDALAHVDRGLSLLALEAVRAAASDLLLPELVAERAFLLAAQGRDDDCDAELASLPASFAWRHRARMRARMVQLVRSGAMVEAGRLATSVDHDIRLSRRDELLFDLVRASNGGAGAAETERLRGELRTFEEGRRWVEAVAPGALAAFERATQDPEPDETEAEREAIADEEADGVRVATERALSSPS
jgi:hypothetical protein